MSVDVRLLDNRSHQCRSENICKRSRSDVDGGRGMVGPTSSLNGATETYARLEVQVAAGSLL